jgi:hypothetical protein
MTFPSVRPLGTQTKPPGFVGFIPRHHSGNFAIMNPLLGLHFIPRTNPGCVVRSRKKTESKSCEPSLEIIGKTQL